MPEVSAFSHLDDARMQELARKLFPDVTTPWLKPLGAARYLGLSVGTLGIWRHQDKAAGLVPGEGKGPKYSRAGTDIRYNVNDLDAWLLKDKPGVQVSPNVGRPRGTVGKKRRLRKPARARKLRKGVRA